MRDLLFPPKCSACGQLLDWMPDTIASTPAPAALCPACHKKWENERLETCGICAKPINECGCMPKNLQTAKCKGFYKLAYYEAQKVAPVQNKILYHIKRKRDVHAIRFLSTEMAALVEALIQAEELAREEIMITYLPRTHAARLEFGTDQAEELARELAHVCGLPMVQCIRRRYFFNGKQKHLSYTRRVKNAEQAFLPSRDVSCKGKTVLLVDDMVTTGAGAASGTKILRHAGAKAVYCFAIASDIVNKDTVR